MKEKFTKIAVTVLLFAVLTAANEVGSSVRAAASEEPELLPVMEEISPEEEVASIKEDLPSESTSDIIEESDPETALGDDPIINTVEMLSGTSAEMSSAEPESDLLIEEIQGISEDDEPTSGTLKDIQWELTEDGS